MEPLDSKASTILGPFIMGYIFSAVFLGIMGTQLFLYFIVHARDRLWLKTLVAILFLANLLDVTFKLVYLYRTLIASFASTQQLLRITWLVDIGPIFTTVILLLLQLFFAWRAFELTNNWIYPTLITIAAIVSAAGGFWYASKLARTPSATRTPENKNAVLLWLVPGLVCYATISAVHLWYLVRLPVISHQVSDIHYSKIQITHYHKFPKLDTQIDQAIRAVVQTCLLVVVLSATDIITYLASHENNLYLIFNLPLSGAFSTTLMACLNSRTGWNCKRLPYESEGRNPVRSYILKPGEVLEFASSRRPYSTFGDTTFRDSAYGETTTQNVDDKEVQVETRET